MSCRDIVWMAALNLEMLHFFEIERGHCKNRTTMVFWCTILLEMFYLELRAAIVKIEPQ